MGRDVVQLGEVKADPPRRSCQAGNEDQEQEQQQAFEHPRDQQRRFPCGAGDRCVVLVDRDHAADAVLADRIGISVVRTRPVRPCCTRDVTCPRECLLDLGACSRVRPDQRMVGRIGDPASGVVERPGDRIREQHLVGAKSWSSCRRRATETGPASRAREGARPGRRRPSAGFGRSRAAPPAPCTRAGRRPGSHPLPGRARPQ